MAGRATDTRPERGRRPPGFARALNLLAAIAGACKSAPAMILKSRKGAIMHQPTLALTASSNTPSVFKFESHAVRIIMINGEPWFVATDVCRALKLSNPSKATASLDEDERSNLKLDRGGSLVVVSESGMYTLALRCRDAVKPNTVPHRFRKWVTSEVLPSVRKTGGYGTQRRTIEAQALAA